ncbi:hypothetical protein K5D51_02760, partial [Pseudomonas cichorii]|nr:hypothetical protein [Pseudomonas cichorii]
SCKLQAASCKLQAASCKLQAASCKKDTLRPPSLIKNNKKARIHIPGSAERVLFRWIYKGSFVDRALWHYTGGHRLHTSPALLSQGI